MSVLGARCNPPLPSPFTECLTSPSPFNLLLKTQISPLAVGRGTPWPL